MADDFYHILSVPRVASHSEISKAYRHLALRYHPDKNADPGALSAFLRISEAYNTLKNEVSRTQYDFQQSFHSLFGYVRSRSFSESEEQQDCDEMESFTRAHSEGQRCKLCTKLLQASRPRFHFLTEHFPEFTKWKAKWSAPPSKRRKTAPTANNGK